MWPLPSGISTDRTVWCEHRLRLSDKVDARSWAPRRPPPGRARSVKTLRVHCTEGLAPSSRVQTQTWCSSWRLCAEWPSQCCFRERSHRQFRCQSGSTWKLLPAGGSSEVSLDTRFSCFPQRERESLLVAALAWQGTGVRTQ